MLTKASTSGYWILWPEKIYLKVYSRSAGDTVRPPINFQTCRKKQTSADDAQAAGVTLEPDMVTFSLWDRGENYIPQPDDVIEEESGERWIVVARRIKIFGNLFSCITTKTVL